MPNFRLAVVALVFTAALARPSLAQELTPPSAFLGFEIGDDYQLATYGQLYDYWGTLARESSRMTVQDIGQTEEGRPQIMAVITAPENHEQLDRYRDIARRLALAEGLTDADARALAADGKAVVWIDGGLHASEVLGAQQLMELVWQMVSRDDPETLRFLNDVIVLAVHANPDGHDLLADWYMREQDPEKRTTRGVPVLYQKYVGHDNNRDFYMSTQAETINLNRVLYREWFPQIVYNHHQTGPSGTVMFAPPFRDPFNYNYHPLIPLSIEAVGTAMHTRFVAEGKGGTTMRSGASYSTWWNGGLRTTPYFHNMIGLLTETIGHPTPMEIPLVLDRQLPRNDLPLPIAPQQWHFRQSIDYSQTANRAVLNYASRNREDLLYNIYVMGRDNILKGYQDSWRTDPRVIATARELAREREHTERSIPAEIHQEVFLDPSLRDPRGYIIPIDQTDFPTATKFVNTLLKNGVAVHRATADFSVGETTYGAGSLVVKTAQAFRPFVLDMFEPQIHPNDFAYPGGPPIAPYDNTGWTLAYQMGVRFDRVLDALDGPFERLAGPAPIVAGSVEGADGAAGFLLSHEVNDGFVATNRLMKQGHEVYWLEDAQGSVYIPNGSGLPQKLSALADEFGLAIQGIPTSPSGDALKMRPVRVGLWDRYGGSMASGWARWILESFEFDYDLVFPKRLDAGALADDFDVLIFVNGGIPAELPRENRQPRAESIPDTWHDRLGAVTVEHTVPRLEEFLRAGGTVIAIGGSTSIAKHLNLGVKNYLVDHEGAPLLREEYFVPGSVVRIRLDNTQPIAWGLEDEVDVHFNNSPVFEITADEVTPVGWFADRAPLRSGWAWGERYLNGGVTIAQTRVGDGQLFLFGPEIIRRAQSHGTFKLLFNGIYLGGAERVELH